jgi:hypothetical protein
VTALSIHIVTAGYCAVGVAIPHLLHCPSEGNAVERIDKAVLGVDSGGTHLGGRS